MIKLIVKLILPLMALALFPASMADATTYRIVVLSSGRTSSDPTHPFIRGLRDGLQEAGYVEGKNLLLSIPQNKSIDELKAIMRGHKKDPADVFITIGVTESVIAKDIITESPIVFMPADDPQGAGLIKSFADPGKNLTGLAYQSAEMRGKQLEVFKTIVPHLKELLVLYDRNLKGASHQNSLHVLNKVAKHLGITLLERPVKSYAETADAVSALPEKQDRGIFILCSNFFTREQQTPKIAISKKLPLYGCPSQVLKFEGLISYAPHLYYIGHRGAWYVSRILQGTTPADLPVETPKKLELIINLPTAAAIGMSIPPEILQRADTIIR